MITSAWTARNTYGIDQDLQLLRSLQLTKQIESVIQIIVKHYILIIFFQFFVQSFHIFDLFAGGAVQLIGWIFLTNILLQNRRKDHHLIHPVVCDLHTEITVGIIQIIFR